MPNDHYFHKIRDAVHAYVELKGYPLDESCIIEAVKCAVEDVYSAIGRKATLVISDDNDAKIVSAGTKEKIPFKSLFAITQPRFLLERAKYHVERKITPDLIDDKKIELNPEYDPEVYLKTVKSTIDTYLRENSYHLEESEVMDAIKCAVEDIYLSMGRKAILDISVMPPKLLDITDEVSIVPFTTIFAIIKPRLFLERVKFFVERFEREKIFATYRPFGVRLLKPR